MAITSQRPAKYKTGERVAFVIRGASRDGVIVGHELAEHRRGYRATDGTLYLVRCDDGDYFDVVERDIADRVATVEDAA